jgi:protein-tyrosine phosphatase
MEIIDAPADPLIPGADRLLDIPGVRNLRDAGGFATAADDRDPDDRGSGGRVRTGLLFRSASLCDLTPGGAERLAALGLRTVIDLRSEPEIRHWPNQRHGLDHTEVLLPTLPPFEDTSGNPDSAAAAAADAEDAGDQGGSVRAGLQGMYAFMADVAGGPIAACARQLQEPGALPALVHCAVGKDRTGVTVAVLLSALGVDDADITADYLLSNHGLGFADGPIFYVDEHGVERESRPVSTELLMLFLDRIRGRHGSTEAFLLDHGLTSGELGRLRALLVEVEPA